MPRGTRLKRGKPRVHLEVKYRVIGIRLPREKVKELNQANRDIYKDFERRVQEIVGD